MPVDFDKYNQDVKEWATRMRQSMQASGQALGIQHRSGSPNPSPSLPQIKNNFKMDAGAIEVIGFRFPRSLIFVHKGAGKGRAGTTGSSWLDQYGNRKQTNPKSKGKMGTGGRVAKPWFTNVLNGADGVETLADLVATSIGGVISENILK